MEQGSHMWNIYIYPSSVGAQLCRPHKWKVFSDSDDPGWHKETIMQISVIQCSSQSPGEFSLSPPHPQECSFFGIIPCPKS